MGVRRYHDLGRLRTEAVCRVHAVLCELVPAELASTRERARRSSSSTASSPIPLSRVDGVDDDGSSPNA